MPLGSSAGLNSNFEWEVKNSALSIGPLGPSTYGGSTNLYSNYGEGLYRIRKTAGVFGTDGTLYPASGAVTTSANIGAMDNSNGVATSFIGKSWNCEISATGPNIGFFNSDTGTSLSGTFEISKLRKLP